MGHSPPESRRDFSKSMRSACIHPFRHDSSHFPFASDSVMADGGGGNDFFHSDFHCAAHLVFASASVMGSGIGGRDFSHSDFHCASHFVFASASVMGGGVVGRDFFHSVFHFDSHFTRASNSLISITDGGISGLSPSLLPPRRSNAKTSATLATSERSRGRDDFFLKDFPAGGVTSFEFFGRKVSGEIRHNPPSPNTY